VCVDANAAARNAARQRWMEKDAKYRSESLKYFNREAQAVRKKGENTRGYSLEISNDLERARYVQGQALKAYEKGFISYQTNKATAKAKEAGRSRTAGRASMLALIRSQGTLEGSVRNEYGINMQRRYRARLAKLQNQQAKARNTLGVRPEYGAPVLMPPSDRLSGALQIASQVASIVSGFKELGAADKTPKNPFDPSNMDNSLSGLYTADLSGFTSSLNIAPYDFDFSNAFTTDFSKSFINTSSGLIPSLYD
tara:strand:+ start:3306 stop:4064 length:759 start_codon:yes stop_codon:yes gene_type:complete